MTLTTNNVDHIGKYLYTIRVELEHYPLIGKDVLVPIEITYCRPTELEIKDNLPWLASSYG